MNVFLIGSGGREHALAWRLSQSPLLTRLYCAPGNPGVAEHAAIADLEVADHGAVARFCRDNAIGLVVVGPEAPLAAGLVDALDAAGVKAFGPNRAAARLESSKGFTKDFCREFGVPTAAYRRFSNARDAREYVRAQPLPIVVKAGGLAAGKGVTVAATFAEAESAIDACFSGALGAAGAEVVIEEFLDGEEASFFALSDGVSAIPFGAAQDHKRAFDGDRGPNTGGMGAYSPAPVVTPEISGRVMTDIITPTVAGMAARGTPFKGVLFAGLMIGPDGPKLIEYNVRFGDPECQVLMMRLKSDLLPVLLATVDGGVSSIRPEWSDETALAVVLAAEGYPGAPRKGSELRSLDKAASAGGVRLFHAGTRLDGERLLADGGRVLNVAATGATVSEARDRAYRAISLIDWPQGFHRRDIGERALARETGA